MYIILQEGTPSVFKVLNMDNAFSASSKEALINVLLAIFSSKELDKKNVKIEDVLFYKQVLGATKAKTVLDKHKEYKYNKHNLSLSLKAIPIKNLLLNDSRLGFTLDFSPENEVSLSFFLLKKDNSVFADISKTVLEIGDNNFRRIEVFLKKVIYSLY